MNRDFIWALAKHIGVSIFEKDGGDISGKGDLPHFQWMKIISGWPSLCGAECCQSSFMFLSRGMEVV